MKLAVTIITHAVASLRLVSPDAVIRGVIPLPALTQVLQIIA